MQGHLRLFHQRVDHRVHFGFHSGDGRRLLFCHIVFLQNQNIVIDNLRFLCYIAILRWFLLYRIVKSLSISRYAEYFSIPYFFYLARSQYWIANCKLPMYVLKKKNQIYLQTWHGTPLKKLAFDIEVPKGTTFYRSGMNEEMMHETYAQDVKKYNYMISPSAFTTEVFQSAFRINRERLIETGYPRNDFLTNYTEEDVLNIKKKLGIPLDKKVLLYAPTWRDNSYITKGYTFKLEVHFDKWQKILGDEYVIVFKPHYLIVNDFDIDQYQGFVYFVEANEDISNLYIIADALVTDYSSVFFDYAILKRPIYFYMYDLIHYRDELRGFYLDIYHDLPGDIIEDENQLLEEIKKGYDYQRLDKFNQRFNNHEDGKASKRVVDIVFK
ncbi:MAG: CDP-glycerol glycerophosphotransferase family protein [Coprobacillus sp.]|nr:CDP-glycerol glycerophosphotransferase family protein [Coprobacillus sp.]